MSDDDVTKERMSGKERFAMFVMEELIARTAEVHQLSPITVIALLSHSLGGMAARLDYALKNDVEIQALMYHAHVTEEMVKGNEMLRTIDMNVRDKYRREMRSLLEEKMKATQEADQKLAETLAKKGKDNG